MNDVKKLKENPIYAMSLSSKELFHSNFWAWLFERNVDYAKIFFGEDIEECKCVEREQKHRDVTIWGKEVRNNKGNVNYDEAYVIENKFKSLPYKEQLLKYQNIIENSGKKFVKGIVTGIIEPEFIEDEDLNKWDYLSYDVIGEKVITVAMATESEGFEKQIIIEYGNMIKTLYRILLNSLKCNGKKWNSYNHDCTKLRINDIYSKLLAAELVEHLRNNLKLEKNVGDYGLSIEQHYGSNGASVDIHYKKTSNDDKETVSVLGIQIEGTQYRWCAKKNIKMKKYADDTNNFFEKMKECGWFVDYDHRKFKSNDEKIIIDHKTGKEHTTHMGTVKGHSQETFPYRLYIPDKNDEYTFMYQYWTFKENETFEDICNVIQNDMELAKAVLQKL